MKRISISEKKELDVFELLIEISYLENSYDILKTISAEENNVCIKKVVFSIKSVLFDKQFYNIKKRNQIGDTIRNAVIHDFYIKNNVSYSGIEFKILRQVFFEKKIFNVKKKINNYCYEKKIIPNNENHFVKHKNPLCFRTKYAKKRFHKFSRNEGKIMSKKFDEDIKFKKPKNILGWLKY